MIHRTSILQRSMKSYLMLLLFILACAGHIANGIEASVPLYKNPQATVETRINDLLKRMTLDEKIGQMTQIERSIADTSIIQSLFVGSILSGGGSAPSPLASPSEWMDMVDAFQRAALGTRLSIPMMYGIDAVHGNNNVYGATIFPHNIGLGCTRDPDLVKRIGAATALEARGTGIPYVFAPCIAVCRHPSWGRCYESFSEDPVVVKSMTEIITGLQGQTPKAGQPFVAGQSYVAATAKHFVGDGGTLNGTDEGNTVTKYKNLADIHLSPYIDAIAKGVATIMVSYSSWNGQKMHANGKLISHVLKNKMKFQGFVISDFMGLDRITNPWGVNYTYSVMTGVNAGVDMVMVPMNYTMFHDNMVLLVKNRFIPMKRINDAVRRILRVKFIMGLFEHPFADRSMVSMVGAKTHRELAREAVRKSLVLLKNGNASNKQLLPLSKNTPKILVAGSHANDIGNQCGGWTMSWQGSSGNITIGTTILEGVLNTVSKSTQVVYDPYPDANVAKGQGFSYAIVVVGEVPYAEYVGDNAQLTIPDAGIETIKNVCTSVKCVVVLISGRPLVIEPYLPMIDAFVAAWLPGTEGQGVSDVLFGDYPFQGKLSRTWFKRADQLPMNVGDKNYDPLFPFGFGLS